MRGSRNIRTLLAFLCGLLLCSSGLTEVLATDNPDELYRAERYREAEKGYAIEIQKHPQDIRYRYNLGCASSRLGHFKKARESFLAALKRAREDSGLSGEDRKVLHFRTAYNLGCLAYRKGAFLKAGVFFREAIKVNPESGEAKHNFALALRAVKEQTKPASLPAEDHDQNAPGRKKNGFWKRSPTSGQKEKKSFHETGEMLEGRNTASPQKDYSAALSAPYPGWKSLDTNLSESGADHRKMSREEAEKLLDRFHENAPNRPYFVETGKKPVLLGGVERDW